MLLSDRANAIVLGLIVVFKGQTTLPWYSYIVALLLGCAVLSTLWFFDVYVILPAFVTPFSQTINGRMGSGVSTHQLMKMVGGVITPGRPVANLYVCFWTTVFYCFEFLTLLSLPCGAMTLLTSPSDLQVISRSVNTSRFPRDPCFLPSSGVPFLVCIINACTFK